MKGGRKSMGWGGLRNVVVGWVRYEVLMFYIIKGSAGSEHAADALQN